MTEQLIEEHPSLCRTCQNTCSVMVQTVDGRIAAVSGDAENPIFHGYTCVKGRSHASLYNHGDRLLYSQMRTTEGEYVPIATEDAIGEIAERLHVMVDRYGPRSVAMFWGTYFALDNPINMSMGSAFMSAIGSPMVFSPSTIDQPGKLLAKGLHGIWMAPGQAMADPDVALLIGTNPMVSHQGRAGHPGDFIKQLSARNAALIVIDPRRTETAKRASIHLQPRPGEDVTILAGLLRVIIEERLYDADFVADNVSGFERLSHQVASFTPDYVARRADVDAHDVTCAARTFASAQRGYATAGTGPNMAGRGTLLEYLVLCLDTVCGHWLRAGDRVSNAISLAPKALQMAKAQALAPFPAFGYGEQLRVRGLTDTLAGLPVSAMADEILTPGDGQVRALISLGGNPLNCVPDQMKNIEAFRALDLLVQTDVQMSPTARMADYVIATKLPYEMATTTLLPDILTLYANGWGYPRSHAQYSPAIVEPPAGADVIEQWQLLYGLAQGMELELDLFPGYGALTAGGGTSVRLNMQSMPTSDELLCLIHADTRIPLSEVKRHHGGALFPAPEVVVDSKDTDWPGRLDVGNTTMMADLGAVADEAAEAEGSDFPFRLISRRMMQVVGSPVISMPTHRGTHNPAFLHPADMERLHLLDGDLVEIRSARGSILAVAEPDSSLRLSTVSMSHSFGDRPELDHDVRRIGSNPGRLIANDSDCDPYSGQPRMSNIPVYVAPHRNDVR